MEIGKEIYNDSHLPSAKQYKKKRLYDTIAGIIAFSIMFFLPISAGIYIFIHNIIGLWILVIVTCILSLLLVFVWWILIIVYLKNKKGVQIYENAIRICGNVYPFSNIQSIYLNPNPQPPWFINVPLPYLTILIKTSRGVRVGCIQKNDIHDIETFLKILKEKTKLIQDCNLMTLRISLPKEESICEL
jgi:hypothetical protein